MSTDQSPPDAGGQITKPEQLAYSESNAQPARIEPLLRREAVPDTLPVFLSTFLGRGAELPRIRDALMQPSYRLVTILGPGGVGKTRIAVEALHRIMQEASGRFPDGIFFTDCAALPRGADIESLWQAISGSLASERGRKELHAPSETTAPRERVLTHLRDARALLLLDNMEHLLPAGAIVAALVLSECPSVTVLSTSRVVLDVAGERLIPVRPLSLPESETLTAAGESDAIRLFVERAQAVRPGFALQAENIASVSRICRLTDGLPLALELAAARMNLFSAEDLARRLADSLRILSGSERLSLRQRSLAALMEWSYSPLTESRKALLDALSIFPDAFDFEAAESVSGSGDAIDDMSGLVDSSLVQVTEDGGGGTRYLLLETIRSFATARLRESGNSAVVHERFGAWAQNWTERAYHGLWGREGGEWILRIARELANIKAALELGTTDQAFATTGHLNQFWWRTNRFREGLAVYLKVTDREGGDEFARTGCRLDAEALKDAQGEPNRILEALIERIAEAQVRGKRDLVVYLLQSLGLLLGKRGRYDESLAAFKDGLILARELNDDFLVGYVRHGMAEVRIAQGDYEEALWGANAALEIFRRIHRPVHCAHTLLFVGQALMGLGRFPEAREALSESLSLARDGEMRDFELDVLLVMAESARMQGNFVSARALYSEVLTLTEHGGPHEPIRKAREGLARILGTRV